MILKEAFDYPFSRLDPAEAPHIDPPSVALYETLLFKSPAGEARPMLARSWETTADGMSWRFHLREDLKFHSGQACDAAAVLAALRTLRAGDSPGGEVWYWMPVDAVRVEGPNTLVFDLRYPYSRLPSLLWGTHTAIHNEAARREHAPSYGQSAADGTGPFRLVDWSSERVVAARWDGYPGAVGPDFANHGPAVCQGIEWHAIPDEQDRLDALLSGRVHCLHGPPLAEVAELRRDGRVRMIEFSQSSNIYLALNWAEQTLGFGDVRLRRAISLGVDRSALISDVLAGQGSPTWGPLGPGDPYHDPAVDRGRGFDPAAADRQLEELGWVLQGDGLRARQGHRLSFECVAQDDQVMRRLVLCLQEQLRRRGIELRPRFAAPFADFYAACDRLPQAFLGKWLWQDGIDAVSGFAATWGQPAPNWQRSSIPQLDGAFRGWLQAGDDAELRAAASLVQRLVAEELPYIPLLTPSDLWVHSPRLHGWKPHPANLYPLYQDCWLEPGP